MFDDCECGQNCPLCEECEKPICECICDDFETDEAEEKDW